MALAGPRGSWAELSVVDSDWSWTFSPDGHLTAAPMGSDTGAAPHTAMLSSEDLDELVRMIDGPQLRRELAESTAALPCDVGTGSVAVLISLDPSHFDVGLGSCLNHTDNDDVLAPLLSLAQRY